MRSGQETTGGGDISPPAPARWAPHGAAGCKIRMGEIWDGRQDARPRGGGCRAWLEEGLARTGAAWAGRGGRGRLSPAGCLRPSSEHNRGDTQRRRRAVSPTSEGDTDGTRCWGGLFTRARGHLGRPQRQIDWQVGEAQLQACVEPRSDEARGCVATRRVWRPPGAPQAQVRAPVYPAFPTATTR